MSGFNTLNRRISAAASALVLGLSLALGGNAAQAGPAASCAVPPFIAERVPPLTLLVLGRDHKLYYEAYNDASDLDGDGVLDTHYKPTTITYFGYFDSYKCYTYSSALGRFQPSSNASDKTCSGAGEWSGDFLNYLTTSRMDALRKVLYGGQRIVDTSTLTVLERAYVPQDAHSWGKEYTSTAVDGYDISQYAPFTQPFTGTRHLFGTTATSQNGPPLLRVATNNTHRIWEWVAKERPVVDNSVASAGGGLLYSSHPGNHADYDTLVSQFAQAQYLVGSQFANNGRIDGSGNPYSTQQDHYLTIFTGTLKINTGGTYQFAVDGDDAVEVIIDGTEVAGWYGGHGSCSCTSHSGSITLGSGDHTVEFRQEENTGADNYYLRWNGPDSSNNWDIVPTSGFEDLTQTVYTFLSPGSNIVDYTIRVEVCSDASLNMGSSCTQYTNGNYKPTGLLQKYGEHHLMYFGLLTGSYRQNTSGGVLRDAMESLSTEIDSDTGIVTSTTGIIATLNKIRVTGFDYSSNYEYDQNCGWITTRPINEAECRMWGNPVGEMIYEGLRYLAGKTASTGAYSTYVGNNDGNDDDSTLGLPVLKTWTDPYDTYPSCSEPNILVLSDIGTSYDSDQLPGSYFGSFTGDLSAKDLATGSTVALNVQDEAQTIWDNEMGTGAVQTHFVGQSATNYDGAPTPKAVNSFANIRGLSPEEPTKQGSYYSASVAYYGLRTDINADADGDQSVSTYAVALASPLPRIEIPVADSKVTLVPFAKSVGGCLGVTGTQGGFQPTDQIVDFFVESITPTTGVFRINYEDVEQGADHDMDAIVRYFYTVNSDNTVTVTLDSTYAAGCVIQHMGYVISGTTQDGIYLEVRDLDTAAADDPDYFLDTPPGVAPGGAWNDNTAQPTTATRTFTPGEASGATLLKDPLWYAAKWGSFADSNGNQLPDVQGEWDSDNDGTPDNYFLVTNALTLGPKLEEAFTHIVDRQGTAAAVSTISQESRDGDIVLRAYFKTLNPANPDAFAWEGHLEGFWPYDVTQSGETVQKYDFEEDGFESCVKDPTPHCWDAAVTLQNRDPSTRVGYTVTGVNATSKRPVMTSFDTADVATIGPLLENNIDVDGDGTILTDTDDNSALISWTLGSWTDAWEDVFRKRGADASKQFKMGDVVYSSPVVVSAPSLATAAQVDILGELTDGSCPTGAQTCSSNSSFNNTCFFCYRAANLTRDRVLYVGANDGMLHAFTVGVWDSSSEVFLLKSTESAEIGKERWFYIPSTRLSEIKDCARATYGTDGGCAHRTMVDLSSAAYDVKIDVDGDGTREWRTVLLGGLRGGGDLYFAVDVTDPSNPVVLWEHSVFRNLAIASDATTYTYPFRSDLVYNFLQDLPMSWSAPQVGLFDFADGKSVSTSTWAPNPLSASTASKTITNLNMRHIAFIGGGLRDYSPTPPTRGVLPVADDLTDAQWQYLFRPQLLALDVETGVDLFQAMWPQFLRAYWDTAMSPAVETNSEGNLVPHQFDTVALIDGDTDGRGERIYAVGLDGWLLSIYGKTPMMDADGTPFTDDMCLKLERTEAIASADLDTNAYRGSYEPIGSPVAVTFLPRERLIDRMFPIGISVTTGKFDKVDGVKDDQTDTAPGTVYFIKEPGVPETPAAYCDKSGSTISAAQFDLKVQLVPSTTDWWCNKFDLPRSGERIVAQSLYAGGLLFFTTFIPNDNVCSAGGQGYLYAMDYQCGGPIAENPFPLPSGAVDAITEGGDTVAFRVELGGGGLPTRPTVDAKGENVIVQTSEGKIIRTPVKLPLGPIQLQGWSESQEGD